MFASGSVIFEYTQAYILRAFNNQCLENDDRPIGIYYTRVSRESDQATSARYRLRTRISARAYKMREECRASSQ